MSNAHTTEIPFLEAIASMTDAELAGYKARYAKAIDSISRIHDHAVRAEIARRAKAAPKFTKTAPATYTAGDFAIIHRRANYWQVSHKGIQVMGFRTLAAAKLAVAEYAAGWSTGVLA
jgi:hypothetical protein